MSAWRDILKVVGTSPRKTTVGKAGSSPTTPPSVAPSGATGYSPGAAAGRLSATDYTWLFWGESAAKAGFTGTTSKAGWPNTYVQAGDTITLEEQRGQPYISTGFTVGVTKTGGGRIKGASSYGATYRYFPGLQAGNITDELARSWLPMPYDKGDVITGESDSAAVNEVTLMCVLASYGAPAHAYPRSVSEVMNYSGIRPKEIWCPQISVTSAGAVTSGSGAVSLDSASQEDIWWAADKTYYICGAVPHLVNNAGMLQFAFNLPGWYNSRNVGIPIGAGANAVTFGSSGVCLPYEAIGPISGTALAQVGLFSTAATATTMGLVIAVV